MSMLWIILLTSNYHEIKVIASIAIEKKGKFTILEISHHDTMPRMRKFLGCKVDTYEKLLDSAKREAMEKCGLHPNKSSLTRQRSTT